MNPRTLYLAGPVILAAIGAAAALAYATVWQLAIFSLLPCLGSVVGLVLALAGLVVRRRARTRESPGWSRVSTALLLAGLFLALQAAYFPIAQGLRNREVRQAQDFTAALIPKLEAYARLHDEYPASAEAVLAGDEEVPRLLQLSGDAPLAYDNRRYYRRQGESYGFRFYLPDGFIGFQFEYCCGVDGVWTVTD